MDTCHCQNKIHGTAGCGGVADECGICIPCRIHCQGIKLQPIVSRVESISILEKKGYCPQCGSDAHDVEYCPRAIR